MDYWINGIKIYFGMLGYNTWYFGSQNLKIHGAMTYHSSRVKFRPYERRQGLNVSND